MQEKNTIETAANWDFVQAKALHLVVESNGQSWDA